MTQYQTNTFVLFSVSFTKRQTIMYCIVVLCVLWTCVNLFWPGTVVSPQQPYRCGDGTLKSGGLSHPMASFIISFSVPLARSSFPLPVLFCLFVAFLCCVPLLFSCFPFLISVPAVRSYVPTHTAGHSRTNTCSYQSNTWPMWPYKCQ